MKSIGNRILGGALAAWLLALASCGTAPTAPQLNRSGEPAGASVNSARAGGASHDGLIGDLVEPLLPAVGELVAPIKNLPRLIGDDGLELVQPVTATTAVTMTVADVTVKVPVGALSGDAEIKVTVPDSTKLECHLEIFPASQNHFAVPVRLEFDVRAAGDPRMMVVYWFDEQARAWVPLTTTMDATTGKVWAELPHFSIYKADCEAQGRAGW
jgi:hypothetical protein